MIDIRKLLGLPTKANELTYWGCIDLKRKKYKQALFWFNRIAEALYYDIRGQTKCKKL